MKTFIKTAVLFTAAIALSGCGSSSPSSGDVKGQLKALFENCDIIKVSDFTKINGAAIDDTHHNVSVKFSMATKPISKVEDVIETYKDQQEKLGKTAKDTKTQILALMEEEFVNPLGPKYSSMTFAERNAFLESPEYLAAVAREKEVRAKLEELRKDPTFQQYTYRDNVTGIQPAIQNTVNNIFNTTCKYRRTDFSERLVMALYQGDTAYTEKTEMEFTADIIMYKTDNGWVMR